MEIEILSGGLVASNKRKILDGSQYDKYFPKAEGKNGSLKRDGTVEDTVRFMGDIVYNTLGDTKAISKVLYATQISGNKTALDLQQTCKNLWDFCYNYMQYELDAPGKEQLRRPARAFRDGNKGDGIDCDCFSIFCSSVLTNLGIPHCFRITKYDGGWQHVYVVVPTKKSPNMNYGGDYITVDPVLDKSNYEKKFTAKTDHNMSNHTSLGIPIEYLEGLGLNDSTHEQVITGADFEKFLSGTDENNWQQDALDSIYKHIVKTRDAIMRNPGSVIAQGGAETWLKMLNYAIANWNTSNRDHALDVLEREEEKWSATLENLEGIEEAGDESGDFVLGKTKIGKFFSKAKETVKAVVKKAKDVATKGVKAIIRYNPLTIASRNAFLLMLKLNMFHMSTRLKEYPTAYAKVKKMFVDILQGKEENLKKQIDKGAARGLRGLGDLAVTGLGVEPVSTTAAVTAAAPPTATTLTALTAAAKAAGKAIPKEDGGGDGSDSKEGLIKRMIEWVKSKLSKKEQQEVETTTLVSDEDKKEAEQSARKSGEGEGEGDGEDKEGFFAKVGGFYKENPVVAWGGTLLATGLLAWGGYELLKPKKKGLSGVKQYRARKRIYGKFLPAGKKVRAVTYAGINGKHKKAA